MKILYVTTISLTMNSFFKPHIKMLVSEGNQVDVACNYSELSLDTLYCELGCNQYQIDFSRSPLSKDNIKAYKQLKELIENGNYDIVHCHTPNASVITRLVCRKFRKDKGLKVFYTAHGFHFYKGAPKLNWLVYYPIEKICSYFTDKLITINKEDYELAKNNFKANETYYVPGVGFDLSKFENIEVDRNAKRKEVGVPEDAFLLLSVGELNENKNHQVVIKALSKLNNPKVHYAIAGVGDKHDCLLGLAKELGLSEQVHLLGYRNDIQELNYSADVFCFPSIREGLGLAAIEAMACGVPVVAADNRGTRSFISNGENGFLCRNDSADEFAAAITAALNDEELRIKFSQKNKHTVEEYSEVSILKKMIKIYDDSDVRSMQKRKLNPLVSIVIPAYNASNYLREAIDSALAQTYKNIEIIVVNDGSRDNGETDRIAKEYGDKIRYFHKENGGSSSALNTGIANMRGDWFSWLSHDDLYVPEKLEKQIAYMNSLEIDEAELPNHIFFSASDMIDAEGKLIRGCDMNKTRKLAEKVNSFSHNGHLIAEPTVYCFHGCSCLVHKEAFEKVGGFDENLRLLNDLDFWYRLYSADYKVHYIPESLVKGRVHSKQVSKSIGYSYHNPEQDMFWNRSLDWLLENYPQNSDLLFRFGRNAYLKTRNAEGDRAFENIESMRIKKHIYATAYKCRASVRNLAKTLYLKIKV